MGVLPFDVRQVAFDGILLAVILGVAILLDNCLGGKGDDGFLIRVDNTAAHQVVVVRLVRFPLVFYTALLASALTRVKEASPVNGHQVPVFQAWALELEGLEKMVSLNQGEEFFEGLAKLGWLNGVKHFPHACITGYFLILDVIHSFQVMGKNRVGTVRVKGQKGIVLLMQHGKSRLWKVGKGDAIRAMIRPVIGNLIKAFANLCNQVFGVKVFADFWHGSDQGANDNVRLGFNIAS